MLLLETFARRSLSLVVERVDEAHQVVESGPLDERGTGDLADLSATVGIRRGTQLEHPIARAEILDRDGDRTRPKFL